MKLVVRAMAVLLMAVLLVFNSCNDDDSSTTPPSITDFSPTEGIAGTIVTINGRNFSTIISENVVKFNGMEANVTAATTTALTVTVPVGASTGKITVQVGTQIGTSSGDFVYVPQVMVSTLAGSGSAGYADGAGAVAQFDHPYGVAVDVSGNLYVADGNNNRIRKITPVGGVSTLAGSGIAGSVDDTGTAAQFNIPYGTAVDASGNVYVTDFESDLIRKVTSNGVVSTLAGSTKGFSNGSGTAAQFNSPTGIAVDASGNVYVADYENHCIRKITSGGVVSTLAGSGTPGFADGAAASAQFYYPVGVAVDASGNVYVADLNNNRIRKVTSGGVVSTLAGNGAEGFVDGNGAVAEFNSPQGIAVDTNGNVYVGDRSNNCIRKITSAGVVSTLAGSTRGFSDGTGTNAQFKNPSAVAVDISGNVYVVDDSNIRIRKISIQ